jgi:hypothetical protein
MTKKYHKEDWLRKQYYELGKSGMQIAEEQGVHYTTIYEWMDKNNIERRTKSEAKMGERNPNYGKERKNFSKKISGSNNPSWKGGINKEKDFRKQTKWKKLSEEIRELVDWQCENCNKHGSEAKEIQTHHANPVSDGGDEWHNIFIVLCYDCHNSEYEFWHTSTIEEQLEQIGGEPSLDTRDVNLESVINYGD